MQTLEFSLILRLLLLNQVSQTVKGDLVVEPMTCKYWTFSSITFTAFSLIQSDFNRIPSSQNPVAGKLVQQEKKEHQQIFSLSVVLV